jgi:hypothetical protein
MLHTFRPIFIACFSTYSPHRLISSTLSGVHMFRCFKRDIFIYAAYFGDFIWHTLSHILCCNTLTHFMLHTLSPFMLHTLSPFHAAYFEPISCALPISILVCPFHCCILLSPFYAAYFKPILLLHTLPISCCIHSAHSCCILSA